MTPGITSLAAIYRAHSRSRHKASLQLSPQCFFSRFLHPQPENRKRLQSNRHVKWRPPPRWILIVPCVTSPGTTKPSSNTSQPSPPYLVEADQKRNRNPRTKAAVLVCALKLRGVARTGGVWGGRQRVIVSNPNPVRSSPTSTQDDGHDWPGTTWVSAVGEKRKVPSLGQPSLGD